MASYKFLPATLLVTTLLLGSFATAAEARRGGRAGTSASASVDVNYNFSIFDTTVAEDAIGCTAITNGCLFIDAISDLEITFLRTGDFQPNPIDEAEIGTSNITLYGPETPPNQATNGILTDFPLTFPNPLSLKAELFPAGLPTYTITDSTGEDLLARLSGSIGSDPEEFTRDFSFQLRSSNDGAAPLPEADLINSLEYIVDVIRAETALPEGYFFSNEFGDPISFQPVDINGNDSAQVPEPGILLGLASLGFLTTRLSRKAV